MAGDRTRADLTARAKAVLQRENPDLSWSDSAEAQPDVPPESSPARDDVPPESSPGEQDGEESPEPLLEGDIEPEDDKEHNFKALREKLEAEKREREALAAELERERRQRKEEQEKKKERDLATQLEAYLSDNLPDDFLDWDQKKRRDWFEAAMDKTLHEREFGAEGLGAIKEVALQFQVTRAIPQINDAQLSIVTDILKAASNLSAKEAFEVAKVRNPSLFQDQAPPRAGSMVPPSHQVNEPSRSGRGRAPVDPRQQLKDSYDKAVQTGSRELKRRAATALVKHQLFGG